MPVRQDRALSNGRGTATAQAKPQPVPDGLLNRVSARSGNEAIMVVAKELLQLGVGLSLDPSARSPNNPLALRRVAHRHRGDPAFARRIPVQSAVSPASPLRH